MSLAPYFATRHQLCALQHSKMLQHCRAIEGGEPVAELTCGVGGLFERIENLPPSRGGESFEYQIIIGGLDLIH